MNNIISETKKPVTTNDILTQQQLLLEQQNQQLLQQQAQLAELEQKRIEQIEFQKLLDMQRTKGKFLLFLSLLFTFLNRTVLLLFVLFCEN
jgi:hypothetical protein